MSLTLLALVNELHERASLLNLVARDQADFEGQALARSILSMALELERHVESSISAGAMSTAAGSDASKNA